MASVIAACGSSSSSDSSSSSSGSAAASGSTGAAAGGQASGTLNGSGSSLQLAYQQAAIEAYKGINSKLTVNYGGGGSGKGRTDLAGQVVDYAGSDSPIKAEDLPTFKGGTVLYFPVVVSPVTVSYNISGVDQQLQLDGATLANIFQGKVTKWNDPSIAAQNSGVTLPDTTIVIARRSDSSGTTDNFSQFLDKSSAGAWTLGTGSTITWPANSQGGNGNGGVAQLVKQTDGAIGYVDFADAQAAGLKWAKVKNQAGTYIDPSPASATAAAATATVNPDLTFSAIWTSAPDGYPISAQSFVLVYEKQASADKAAALQEWVGYLVGDGQKLLPDLGYGSVPDAILTQAKAQTSKITG